MMTTLSTVQTGAQETAEIPLSIPSPRTARGSIVWTLQGLSGRIGILGGTFDPITNGHLAAALAVKTRLNLDTIVFAPTGQNPLKPHPPLASGMERVEMVCGAIESMPGTFVWPYEVLKDPRCGCFTVDLLRQAHREIASSNAKLFFIVGADCVRELHRWNDLEEIAARAEFVPVTRGGTACDVPREASSKLPPTVVAQLTRNYVDFDALECSATDAREILARGEIPNFLPPSVVEFEKRRGIYRGALNSVRR